MTPTLVRATRRGLITIAGVGLLFALAAGPAWAGPDLCVSTKGTERVQKGSATCSSTNGAGNVAIARGVGAEATAGIEEGDKRNKAKAFGDGSRATAGFGDGNTATVSGDRSSAGAAVGNDNTAVASGDDSSALAANGDGNTAVAGSDGCGVFALGGGTTASC